MEEFYSGGGKIKFPRGGGVFLVLFEESSKIIKKSSFSTEIEERK